MTNTNTSKSAKSGNPNAMLFDIPQTWIAPFAYALRASVKHPEIAAWPTLFLSAYNGDEEALRGVLVIAYAVYFAGKAEGTTEEQRTISNAITWTTNQLCELWEKREADALAAAEAATREAATQPTV